MDEELLVTYWEDEISGLIEIGNYAREIFNQDLYVRIQGKHADDRRRLTKWTVATQKSVEFLEYYDHGKTLDEDLDYIFENLKCTGYLRLYATPSENYRPAKPPVFNLNELKINISLWIKQEDLFGMNCNIVILRYSKLTSQDFNVFLKHWMTGGCSELENFCVFVDKPIDYEIVLDGVEFTKRGEDVERIYVDEEEHHYTIKGGFDIKRPEDNITATVRDGSEDRRRFWMSVWPDYAGNSY